MKKRLVMVLVGLAVGVAAYLGTRLWAQPTATPQPPPQTRVAFVNLEYILMHYQKALLFKGEIQKSMEPFRKRHEDLLNYIQNCQKKMGDPKFDPKNREEWDQAIVKAKRGIEDNKRQADLEIGKKAQEQSTQLFREVLEVIRGYANSSGFHVVFAFEDQGDPWSPLNMSRKTQGMMGTGCVTPVYFHPGLDISIPVTSLLNQRYPGAALTPTSGTSVGPPPLGTKKN